MAEMGRPKINIDFEQFEKLCGLHCTLTEIAAWFKCSEDTIENKVKEHYGQTFSEVFKQKRAIGRISLRREMMSRALGGNTAVLIFLSKNLLGFGDRVVTESATENEHSKLVISMEEEKA